MHSSTWPPEFTTQLNRELDARVDVEEPDGLARKQRELGDVVLLIFVFERGEIAEGERVRKRGLCMCVKSHKSGHLAVCAATSSI